MTLPALPPQGSTNWYGHYSAMDGLLRQSGPAQTTDKILYVATHGSDSNDGLSWGGALATLPAAFSKLGFGPGTIEVGAGTFSTSGMVPNGGQVIRGRGRTATTLQLSATGTLINLSGVTGVRMEHLGLKFATTSVTGTLINLSNTFTCDFVDVQLTGLSQTTGQVGVSLTNNAGDSRFSSCFFDNLDVGVQADSTVNYLIGCVLTGNNTAAQGGDASGAVHASGLVATDCVFRGTGNFYVNVLGTAQQWHLKGCWFDSAATTAVQVGSGTYGPWLFSMTDIPYLAGSTKSLVLNAADNVELRGVVFGNSGSNPTDLTVAAANCPKGTLGAYKSLQGYKIETLVPVTWQGARGYAQSADGSVSLLESYERMNVSITPLTRRRMVIRIVNRTTASTQDVITFPSAFETTFGGGQFAKTFDNSGITGLTLTASSITFPAGVACASGVIVLEGF